MSGKVVIVTGGNGGIGKETVKALLAHKAKVYIFSRDASRTAEAIQSLKSETGQDAIHIQMDLAELSSVKQAAEEFKKRESALHVLINNAGVMMPDPKALTKDGYDLQFGVNVLGHYYLTVLLLDSLKAAASAPGAQPSRVVNLSSAGHLFSPGINWDTLRDGKARQKMPLFELYNQSKFANVVFSSELAKRYGDQGIVSTSLHPGLIISDLGRDMSRGIVRFIGLFSYDAAKGALTSLYAASAPENVNANGKYFVAWARKAEPNPKTLDPQTGEKLWSWCEEQVKGL